MNHPKKERTFVIIKPDGVQRALIGAVLRRIERTGLKLVALKFTRTNREQVLAHYNKDDAWCVEKGEKTIKNLKEEGKKPEKKAVEYGRDILEGNIKFLTSCPILVMVWEGNQAVGVVKKIVGGTEPLTSDVGTIRGDLTIDSYHISNIDGRAVRNLAHCSDSVLEAKREIKLWFSEDELFSYRLINEEILYDVNLDGLLE